MARTGNEALGRRAEALALAHLEARGLKEITSNFRCRMGEVDLVMQDGKCLVFAEVRFRRRNRFTSAAASVGHHKQRKIIRTAAVFLGLHPQYHGFAVRFDVIGLDHTAGRTTVEWIRDAFRP